MMGVGMMMGNMFNMMNATPSSETMAGGAQAAQPQTAQVVEDRRRARGWGIPSNNRVTSNMASWQPGIPRLNWIFGWGNRYEFMKMMINDACSIAMFEYQSV